MTNEAFRYEFIASFLIYFYAGVAELFEFSRKYSSANTKASKYIYLEKVFLVNKGTGNIH
jgi:hypothetical protein